MSELAADLVFLKDANGDSRRIHSPIPTILLENSAHEIGSGGDSPVMMVPSHELPFSFDAEKGTQRQNGRGRPPTHSNLANQVKFKISRFSTTDRPHHCQSKSCQVKIN